MPAATLPRAEVLRAGERDGAGAILRLTTPSGVTVHAVGVPQDWYSPTGPTWIYVVEGDGLTLIDAGSVLAVDALRDAFGVLGLDLRSVRRIVVTHSHLDHDGGALSLSEATGGEVWAHLLFDRLRFYSFKELMGPMDPLLRQAFLSDQRTQDEGRGPDGEEPEWHRRHRQYDDLRRRVQVARPLQDGDQAAGFTFYHTPGHSPDELTIGIDGLLFTGDHVLPEITPHPTTKVRSAQAVRDGLPPGLQDQDRLYGLATYLRSLKRVASYGDRAAVMPAHRLLNRGRLNVMTARRAHAIILHHLQRIGRILGIMGKEAMSLEAITKLLFSYRDMNGGDYRSALTETLAHIELLVDAGDVVQVSNHRLLWKGTEAYREAVAGL